MQANDRDSQGETGDTVLGEVLREVATHYGHNTVTDMQYDEELGELIRQERIARGLTAEGAAERADLAYKTYLRVENGKKVRHLTWKHVERLFGLKPGVLLSARAKRMPIGLIESMLLSARYIEQVGRIKQEQDLRQTESSRTATQTRSTEASRYIGYESGKPIYDWQDFEETIAHSPVEKRLLGLNLDGLRRLRDMIDGAIFTLERPAIEARIAAAAVKVAEATRRTTSLREEQVALTAELEEARHQVNYAGGSEELMALRERQASVEHRYYDARIFLDSAQMEYESLSRLAEERAEKARHYLTEGKDAEH